MSASWKVRGCPRTSFVAAAAAVGAKCVVTASQELQAPCDTDTPTSAPTLASAPARDAGMLLRLSLAVGGFIVVAVIFGLWLQHGRANSHRRLVTARERTGSFATDLEAAARAQEEQNDRDEEEEEEVVVKQNTEGRRDFFDDDQDQDPPSPASSPFLTVVAEGGGLNNEADIGHFELSHVAEPSAEPMVALPPESPRSSPAAESSAYKAVVLIGNGSGGSWGTILGNTHEQKCPTSC